MNVNQKERIGVDVVDMRLASVEIDLQGHASDLERVWVGERWVCMGKHVVSWEKRRHSG